jgi:hypothetical protein
MKSGSISARNLTRSVEQLGADVALFFFNLELFSGHLSYDRLPTLCSSPSTESVIW